MLKAIYLENGRPRFELKKSAARQSLVPVPKYYTALPVKRISI